MNKKHRFFLLLLSFSYCTLNASLSSGHGQPNDLASDSAMVKGINTPPEELKEQKMAQQACDQKDPLYQTEAPLTLQEINRQQTEGDPKDKVVPEQVSIKRQVEKEKLARRQAIFEQNMQEKKAYHQYKMNVVQKRNNFQQKVKKDNFEMEKEKDKYYREQRRQAGQKELERKKKANEASLKKKEQEAKEQLETQEEANSLALKRQRDQYEKDLEDQRQKNKARMESLKKQQEEEREKWNKLLHKEHEEKLKEIPDSSKLELGDEGESHSLLLDKNSKIIVGVNLGRPPTWRTKSKELASGERWLLEILVVVVGLVVVGVVRGLASKSLSDNKDKKEGLLRRKNNWAIVNPGVYPQPSTL